MNPLKPFDVPSLGSRIRTRRQQLGLSVKAMALRLGLALERMRVLEADVGVPTIDEFTLLTVGLEETVPRIQRAMQVSALAQLAEALDPSILERDAIAARPVLQGPVDECEAVWLLPASLRVALCDAMQVSRDDRAAIDAAFTALKAEPPEVQRIVSEAAVVQMVLDGEPAREPLLP